MRVLAEKSTGNYNLTLQDLGDEGEEYVLRVLYAGEWASGEAVEFMPLWIEMVQQQDFYETLPVKARDKFMRDEFRRRYVGDLNVINDLEIRGISRYTSKRR